MFSTLKGQPVLSSYVRNLFKRIGKKAALTKRIHAHGMDTASPPDWRTKRSIYGSFSRPSATRALQRLSGTSATSGQPR